MRKKAWQHQAPSSIRAGYKLPLLKQVVNE
jgi:hypothetical protein